MVICPLCGFEYPAEGRRSACANCPAGAHCRTVCCPNCGYAVEPGTGDRTPDPAATVALASLGPGVAAEIVDLDTRGAPDRLRALAGLGLLPGVSLRVVRVAPTLLVRLGNRDVALDLELAGAVRVSTSASRRQ